MEADMTTLSLCVGFNIHAEQLARMQYVLLSDRGEPPLWKSLSGDTAPGMETDTVRWWWLYYEFPWV